MGRLLGAHDSDDLDRPDLNKCPDCGCFFAQDNCPLCGKECPSEMRAGNRKAVKVRKRRNSGSARVTFIEWYHSWWFIILMMLVFPIVGIALLATSPYKRSSKMIFIVLAVIYGIISFFGIGNIVNGISGLFERPVDTSLSREEYVERCQEVAPEEYFRNVGKYEDEFVSIVLRFEKKIIAHENPYSEDYNTYYMCMGDDDSGKSYSILIRDCRPEITNFLEGDILAVYGEGAGNITYYDTEYNSSNCCCINAAYIELGE